MAKYLIKRILYSLLSIVVVTFIIMLLIFQLKSRDAIFTSDTNLTHLNVNEAAVYRAKKLEEYDYLDYYSYADWVNDKMKEEGRYDTMDPKLLQFYKTLPARESDKNGNLIITEDYKGKYTDSEKVVHHDEPNPYLYRFRSELESEGYTVTFKNQVTSRIRSVYFATRDYNVFHRLGKFFGQMFTFETPNDVSSSNLTDRYIRWEWDNISGAPALVGSGTEDKYLIYYDELSSWFTSQQWFHFNLGVSYTGDDKDRTIEDILLQEQGTNVFETTPYPKQYELIESTYGVKGIDFTVQYFSANGTPNDTSDDALVESKTKHITSNCDQIVFDNIYDYIKVFDKDGNQLTACFPTKSGEKTDTYSPFANAGMALNLTNDYDFYFNADTCVTVVVPTSIDYHSLTYSDIDEATYLSMYSSTYYDRYVNYSTKKNGLSTMGYSFLIGIVATLISYLLGIPFGIWMARRKDKFVDHLGMAYIIFIIAVPSLAYIAIFRALGGSIGLPTKFQTGGSWLYYVLPAVSLALPSIGSLMKWTRRYMIDQANADYVKFARSQGYSEGEIFRKHIAKNAAIPLIQGIPGSILSCLTGAFITERFYAVPGTGKLLTTAINNSDNGEIVALAFFYTLLSIISLILGDILITMIDPRISFVDKGSTGRKRRIRKKTVVAERDEPAEPEEKAPVSEVRKEA